MGSLEARTTEEGKERTYLDVGDWEDAHSAVVLSLIPVLIYFPEDVDSISFLKRQLPGRDRFQWVSPRSRAMTGEINTLARSAFG